VGTKSRNASIAEIGPSADPNAEITVVNPGVVTRSRGHFFQHMQPIGIRTSQECALEQEEAES